MENIICIKKPSTVAIPKYSLIRDKWFGIKSFLSQEHDKGYLDCSLKKQVLVKSLKERKLKKLKEKHEIALNRSENARIAHERFRRYKNHLHVLKSKILDEDSLMSQMNLCAIKIQKVYRGYLVRKSFESTIVQYTREVVEANIKTIGNNDKYLLFFIGRKAKESVIIIQKFVRRVLFRMKISRLQKILILLEAIKEQNVAFNMKNYFLLLNSRVLLSEAKEFKVLLQKLKKIKENLTILKIKNFLKRRKLKLKTIRHRVKKYTRRYTALKTVGAPPLIALSLHTSVEHHSTGLNESKPTPGIITEEDHVSLLQPSSMHKDASSLSKETSTVNKDIPISHGEGYVPYNENAISTKDHYGLNKDHLNIEGPHTNTLKKDKSEARVSLNSEESSVFKNVHREKITKGMISYNIQAKQSANFLPLFLDYDPDSRPQTTKSTTVRISLVNPLRIPPKPFPRKKNLIKLDYFPEERPKHLRKYTIDEFPPYMKDTKNSILRYEETPSPEHPPVTQRKKTSNKYLCPTFSFTQRTRSSEIPTIEKPSAPLTSRPGTGSYVTRKQIKIRHASDISVVVPGFMPPYSELTEMETQNFRPFFIRIRPGLEKLKPHKREINY